MTNLSYATNLNFHPNLSDIVPDYNVPDLKRYSDKVILPQFILENLLSLQDSTGVSLPRPLIFKISTAEKKSCYVGVREFSSVERYIVLPQLIQEKLSMHELTKEIPIKIELAFDVPKGNSLILKPLDPDYDVSDWKFFLEAKLTNDYTTLTQNDMLYIEESHQVYKLLIDRVAPSETISIIDTDIDLSIEPLNDEHAKSMLLKNLKMANEVVELKDKVDIKTLAVQADDYKFKVPISQGQKEVMLQLVIHDREFDNNLADIFVSEDKDVGKETFQWSTLNPDYTVRKDDVIQLKITLPDSFTSNEIFCMPFLWTTRTILELRIPTKLEEVSEEEPTITELTPDQARCDNCGAAVSKTSLFLHQNFCLRNNIKCPDGCGKIFHKSVPLEHWHCKLCSQNAFGDSDSTRQHHNNIFHTAYTCQCQDQFPDFLSFAHHKATDCALKLHECRFCHLVVPRGKSTTTDIFNGLSNHESGCGAKTIDCSKCNKPIMLLNYETHMKLHDMDRVSQLEPRKCCNENCVNTKNINEFGLCDICFAPSFSNVFDPTNAKLQARFERRYVIQLSRGCGAPWCKNKDCKSSGLSKFDSMSDILKHVRGLLVKIPKLPVSTNTGRPFYDFCVDSSMTKRKLLAEWLFEDQQYSYNWCCEAAGEAADEQSARNWLKENAVSLHE